MWRLNCIFPLCHFLFQCLNDYNVVDVVYELTRMNKADKEIFSWLIRRRHVTYIKLIHGCRNINLIKSVKFQSKVGLDLNTVNISLDEVCIRCSGRLYINDLTKGKDDF